ncbi:MAG: DUF115 domain-containing protein [Gammaproteobacteria bacterium]|nr:DUF115 domain-containing protein [Gammaproteobacteria bacterium]
MQPNSPEMRFVRTPSGEEVIYEVNRTTFDKDGSTLYFEHHYRDTLWQENSFYLIVGTDSGLLYNYIAARETLPKGSRYLFIEEEQLLTAIRDKLTQHTHRTLHLCAHPELNEKLEELSFNTYCILNSEQVVESIGALDGHYAPLTDLKSNISSTVANLVFVAKANLSSRVFLKKMLENVAESQTPLSQFAGIFSGKTAILLGRGPSVDLAFDWVREHRDNLIVAAVSSLSKKLLQEKITPDFVFTVDPQPVSFNVSRELLLMDQRVILFHKTHAESILLMGFQGRKIYIDHKYPWASKNAPKNIFGVGPTVVNTAITALTTMGFSEIFLAGVDMCFSPEGFSHSKGTRGAHDIPFSGRLDHTVRTNRGGYAETDSAFFEMQHSLANQAKIAHGQGIRLISIAPDAAKTDFIEFRELADLTLTNNEPLQLKETLDQHFLWISEKQRIKSLKETLTELKKSRRECREVIKKSKEAIAEVNLLFANESDGREKKHSNRIDKIEKALDTKFSHLINAIKYFNIIEFLKTIRHDEEYGDKDSKLRDGLLTYYHAYIRGSELLGVEIDQAITTVEANLEEYAPSPDYPKLFAFWDRYASSWRAVAFLQRRGVKTTELSPEIRDKFEQYQENSVTHLQGLTSFEQWQQETATELDLTHVRNRAVAHFRNHNREGLEQIIRGLKLLQHQEKEEHLNYFSGLLDELGGDSATALEHYQQITSGYLLEDALRRIAYISTTSGDLDSLVLALECLSQISIEYLLQLATVYTAQGKVEEAAESYTRYLDRSPNDTFVLSRLGELFAATDNREGAAFIYNHILTLEPEHPGAREGLQRLTP